MVIGITGPSGAGKGELSRILRDQFNFEIIDADDVYHSLVSYRSDCLNEIVENFGNSVCDASGALDRSVLRSLVFGDKNKARLELLNRITHKHVVNEIRRLKSSHQNKNCVIDAPLLIEAGLLRECDFSVSVIADKAVRAARISKRDELSLTDAFTRILSQKDDDFYSSNTDYTVTNNGDLYSLELSLRKILRQRRITIEND